MAEEQLLRCSCRAAMTRVGTKDHPDGTQHLEFYQCTATECARRVCLWWELTGRPTEEQRSWVEREVARNGAFFPSDYR